MITAKQIIDSLQITEMQLQMAIYSGRIPKPNAEGGWLEEDVVIHLQHWRKQLDRKAGRVTDPNITIGCMTFPKHTR